MRLAVVSGKGGSGKTLTATNLAFTLTRAGQCTAYVDCDVEEPNGHIFIKPEIMEKHPVSRLVPAWDESVCTHCGRCGEICRFSALVVLAGKVMLSPDLCHACGGCVRVCPSGALREIAHPVGEVECGGSGSLKFVQGRLRVGEALAVPVIRGVLQAVPPEDWIILDGPPGTACPMVETVRHSDFTLVVAEATPFGKNDLQLTLETLRALQLPFGVLINRADLDQGEMEAFCRREGIAVLGRLPEDRRIAEVYSQGDLIVERFPEYRKNFEDLAQTLTSVTQNKQGSESCLPAGK